jgi:hypothetical protein
MYKLEDHMSLSKETVVDKIEVLENGCVQVRQANRIMEDGKIISSSYHRSVVSPGQDYSDKPAQVQAICAVTHTAEVIAAYQAMQQGAAA